MVVTILGREYSLNADASGLHMKKHIFVATSKTSVWVFLKKFFNDNGNCKMSECPENSRPL